MRFDSFFPIVSVLQSRPQAYAKLRGSRDYPNISGMVKFYQTNRGVVVCVEVCGLPEGELSRSDTILGFHIHEGNCCRGDADDPFAGALTHYNPDGYEHPYHAGDLPPLFAKAGYAFSIVLTGRICVGEIIGKTVVIHDQPDDFSSHSSGHAGAKIACGVICRNCR